jgi:DNA-binding GntR family transcriptional regulator
MASDASDKPRLSTILNQGSLKERAYEALRTAIVDGVLVAGKLYSVHALADAFSVSRTPVREALIDLASQGMVRFERNRGVRILQTSTHDLQEIWSLRLLLEVPATHRATLQIDDAALAGLREQLTLMEAAAAADDERGVQEHDKHFHAILLGMSGNQRLADYVGHLRDLIITRGASTAGPRRSLPAIVEEHREILEHVARRDAAAAARSMKTHIERTGRLLLELEGHNAADPALAWARYVTPAGDASDTP